MSTLPISAIAGQTLPADLSQVPSGEGRLQTLPLDQGDHLAFDRVAQQPTAEVQAAAIPSDLGLADRFSSGLQDASVQLSKWQKSHSASVGVSSASSLVDPAHPITNAMAEAVGNLQGAYQFAIETTLASRGSTELTKVFNTLLKGQ